MTSAAIELQKAVFAALAGDEALSARLGGVRIHDHAPASVTFPYLTFGRTSVFDWSTSTESGGEHIFSVHVWSKAKGKSEALEIADLVRQVLDDVALDMEGHRLVSLRREFEEVRYNDDHAVHHGVVRFRALTEPLG